MVIETSNISVDIGHIKALQNISMEVPKGTIFGFIGPNGAGKTTSIRVLLGLLKQTSGTASVLHFDTLTESDKIRQRCGVLLEHHGLYEMLSASDNLEYYGRIFGLSRNERSERIKELLIHIGLWDRRAERVGTWSKGMKQKLAIARCFLHRPELIFLDEPTSGLDPEAIASQRSDLIKIVEREGTSIFLTTHNLDEAEKICNNLGIIDNGRLIAIGSMENLKNSVKDGKRYQILGGNFTDYVVSKMALYGKIISKSIDNVVIELNDPDEISALISELLLIGAIITEVKKTQQTLEQSYLTIMKNNQ